jgi:hypothetical protein
MVHCIFNYDRPSGFLLPAEGSNSPELILALTVLWLVVVIFMNILTVVCNSVTFY